MSQTHAGVPRPVTFASRVNPTEQRYSVGERKALACISACKRWHLYLYGRSFTIHTDHQALTALLSTSGTVHRLRLHWRLWLRVVPSCRPFAAPCCTTGPQNMPQHASFFLMVGSEMNMPPDRLHPSGPQASFPCVRAAVACRQGRIK